MFAKNDLNLEIKKINFFAFLTKQIMSTAE